MLRKLLVVAGVIASGLLLAGLGPALAVIQVLIPLQTLLDDSDFIFIAKVERLDPDKPSAVLNVERSLKGENPIKRLPINLLGDKERHTPQLLKRLAVDLPVVVCIKKQEKGKYMALAFSNGTWFQILGQADGDNVRWSFTHCEIYLRRTFKGTTAELEQTLADVLAGKIKAPPPNSKEPAGFGPELGTTESKSQK
jgi:hypothetical protein